MENLKNVGTVKAKIHKRKLIIVNDENVGFAILGNFVDCFISLREVILQTKISKTSIHRFFL